MSGWSEAALGGVAQVFNGKTPSKAEQRDEGHPVLKIRDVSEFGRFRDTFNSFVDPKLAEKLSGKKIQRGDILILNAAHNADYVGSKTYRAESPTFGALATGEWLVVRASEELSADYAYHWFTSQDTRRKIRELVNGIHLYPKDVARLNIPLPPLPEQRRIAAILDKADALRTQRREALAQLDRLAQAIFVEMFGDPVTNPKGWPLDSLTEVCHCYSGGTPAKSNSEYWSGRQPWFSAKDLKAENLYDSQDHISESVTQMTNLRLLPASTVSIVVRGMILAHTFPVSVLRVPATINQDLKALLPRGELRPQFLAASLRAQQAFVLEKVSEAGHGTKRLDTIALQEIKIPRVSVAQQDEFESRYAAVERLRIQSVEAANDCEAMFSSLQHRAFRGEL